MRGGGEIAAVRRHHHAFARARDRTPRRRRDRRAASACSRRRLRRRGSRPTENRCGARDRPSARYCRSSTAPAEFVLEPLAAPPARPASASSRCQASVEFAQHFFGQIRSDRSAARMRSRLRRCSTSSLAKRDAAGAHLLHAGLVFARQASAKAIQSSLLPSCPRIRSASRATDVRQSTRVPNTSKNSARRLIMGASRPDSPASSGTGRGHRNRG